jgi:3-deoxy-D-manno-octulosonate 8-phosphate phosphatase (KDO 8-P phosphatase)
MADTSCPVAGNGYSDCDLTQALRERAMERNKPVERSPAWQETMMRAKKIKLLLLDVDGVLTDGTLIYSHEIGEAKGFNTQDGFGLRLLQDAGVVVGLITARSSEAVSRRAAELKLAHIYSGHDDKLSAFKEILQRTGLSPEQTAYMGDDLLDLPVLLRCGCSFAPANGVAEVRQRVHYVTERSGGQGAVREACELILEARGQFAEIVRSYAGC